MSVVPGALAVAFVGAPLGVLAGVLGGGAAALTALYLLRLRRRRVVVPFAALWARALGDKRSESLWRRLKRILSLLVQLAVLVLLVGALGDPRPARGERGRTVVLIVDASASMRATDGGSMGGRDAKDRKSDAKKRLTRIERAKREARELVAGLAAGDLATVVRMDGQPLALGGLESDLRELERRVDGIEPSDEPADLDGALRLAADVLRGQPRPTVVLIGDGAWPADVLERVRLGARGGDADADADAKTGAAKGASGALAEIDLRGVDLRFVPIGSSSDNLAITAFAVRRYRQNRGAYEVTVEVQSFREAGTAPVRARLEILQDGEVVDVEPLELKAGERIERVLPDLAGAGAATAATMAQVGVGTRLEARLLPARDAGAGADKGKREPSGTNAASAPPSSAKAGAKVGDGALPETKDARLDALEIDDHAYAVLPPRRKLKVLLISDGDLFLEGALLLNENLDVNRVPPSAWDPALAARHDAIVFDGWTPPSPLAPEQERPSIWFDPRGPSSPWRVVRDEPQVLVTETAEKHPVMRWVTLSDLNVARAAVFALGPGDVALASSLRAPILVARDGAREGRAGARQVGFGFTVRRSDLPLRVAFPVLLVNAFDWIAGEDSVFDASWRTGRTVRLEAPGARAVRVRDPDGREAQAPVVEGRAHWRPAKVGFYTVHGLNTGSNLRPVAAAASLVDAAESAIRPATALTVDGVTLEAPAGFRRGPRREWWAYLVLAALGVAFIEWWTYHRRVTV